MVLIQLTEKMKRRNALKLVTASTAASMAGYNIAAAQEPKSNHYQLDNATQIHCPHPFIVEIYYMKGNTRHSIALRTPPDAFETDYLSLNILNLANKHPNCEMIIELSPQLDQEVDEVRIDVIWDTQIKYSVRAQSNVVKTFIRK